MIRHDSQIDPNYLVPSCRQMLSEVKKKNTTLNVS